MSSTSATESARQFVDANILIYSFDTTAGAKRLKAIDLLDRLWRGHEGCVSLQVLQEFFVTVTRKLRNPISAADAARKVADLTDWAVHEPSRRDVLAAIDLHQRLQVSFWDAMIVHSAKQMDCSILWTEDLNDGQRYAGVLVRDPFADSVME
jgi:predicted nucleic acid-binding protein